MLYKKYKLFYLTIRRFLFTLFGILFIILNSFAQCPVNIDFEEGSLKGWSCWIGQNKFENGANVVLLNPTPSPVPGRHTLFSLPSNETDPYGGFPINCPNGSGHSIKLGNDTTMAQAEAVSYKFTIPAGQNKFSLIYNYAVVFQDPGHFKEEQPKLEIEIKNVTDNTTIGCSSFSFIANTSLPGFYESSVLGIGNVPVWCKDWSATSINLDGYAGKTIELFFKTADCTRGAHFGYAYIDVNTDCSNSLVGAAFCPGDIATDITAPYGYQSYTWYNSTFSQVLGTQQKLHLSRASFGGSTVAVEVIPYDGYGCKDTLYAQLDTISVEANAGLDNLFCNTPVPLGEPPKPGLSYNWFPAEGLSDPNISNPVASPSKSTKYILSATLGGGCTVKDTAEVYVPPTPVADFLVKPVCVNLPVSITNKTVNNSGSLINYLWDFGNGQTSTAQNPVLSYSSAGTYPIKLTVSTAVCPATFNTKEVSVLIEDQIPGITYPVKDAVINFPFKLQARVIGNSVLWSPAKNLDNAKSYSPVFYSNKEQLYTIEMKTALGCVTIDTQLVKVFKKIEIFVPTAFSPNGDGLNDYLRPVLMGFNKINYFKVYNRWGELIFQMNSDKPGWDGKVKGIVQDTQAVIWMIEAEDIDGTIHKKQGTSVIVK